MKTEKFDKAKQLLIIELEKTNLKTEISVGVYGSYARKEAILGWSDLDILIFCKQRIINSNLLMNLRKINIILSENFPEIPITFRIHSIDEFPEYKQFEGSICSYALFSYMKDIKFIFGEDLRDVMRDVIKTISISTAISDLKSKLLSSRHESRSIITSSNNSQPFTQSFHINIIIPYNPERYAIAKYIDYILECCLCCNILKGSFKRKKEEIATEFIRIFPNFKHCDLVLEAINIRNFWGDESKITNGEKFIEKAVMFFEEIINLFDEYLEINQINNSFEGLLINDSNMSYRKNACVILKNKKNRFLIVRKKNEWGFIQGGIEEEDKDLEDTVYRELKEEINLDRTNLKLIATSNYKNVFDWPTNLQKNKQYRGQEQYFYLMEIIEISPNIFLNKNELDEFKWVNCEELKSLIDREDLKESLFFISKEFPIFFKK